MFFYINPVKSSGKSWFKRNMKVIKVEELKEGAIFTKAAYIDPGNVFVLANTPLTDKDIQRLRTFRIKEISTEGEMLAPGADLALEDISLVPDGIAKDGGAKIKNEINNMTKCKKKMFWRN